MSKRTERKLGWPLEPGAVPKITELVTDLVDEMETAAPADGVEFVLVEVEGGDRGEIVRLAERVAAAWTARGRPSLVVDAHPVAPFTAECFEQGLEGFTEILHYGLSPEAAAREREGCAGLWIPAGGRWSLPLESPDEPRLSLFRLGKLAPRVLLLADAADAEGLLDSLRVHSHYQLQLVSAVAAAPVPPSAQSAEPPPPQSAAPVPGDVARPERLEETTAPRVLFSGAASGPRRRRRLWLLLPALLILAVIAWSLRERLGGDAPPRLAGTPAVDDEGFSHLPAPVELPYHGGQREESAEIDAVASSEAPVPESGTEDEPAQSAAPLQVGQDETSAPTRRPAAVASAPSEDPRVPSDPAAAASAGREEEPEAQLPRRRFESRTLWQNATTHTGQFFVHVESYQDSSLAAKSARQRGFDRAGFVLRPVSVKGERYYRLLIGPFGNLTAAAAYRDSLLDRTGEDYCTIVPD